MIGRQTSRKINTPSSSPALEEPDRSHFLFLDCCAKLNTQSLKLYQTQRNHQPSYINFVSYYCVPQPFLQRKLVHPFDYKQTYTVNEQCKALAPVFLPSISSRSLVVTVFFTFISSYFVVHLSLSHIFSFRF